MANGVSTKTNTAVYIGLLVLLTSTIGLSYVRMGTLNFVAAFAIAAAKTSLILVFFMQLKRGFKLAWIYAGVGAVWLLIATLLTFADYLTRGG